MAEETLDPEHQTQGDTKEGTAATHLPAFLFTVCLQMHMQPNYCTSILLRSLVLAAQCCQSETLQELKLPLCAGLYFGREVPFDCEEAKLPLHGPNQWPSEVVTQIYTHF